MTEAESRVDTDALGSALAGLFAAPAQVAAALAGSLASVGAVQNLGTGGCAIPPPCWEPRRAGACTLTLPPGGTGTIRIHVMNCGWSRNTVGLTAAGKIAGWLTFEPTTGVLDPQERVTFLVKVHVPNKIQPGTTLAGPLLVRGCLDHYVRLQVTVDECAGVTCCDVSVDDCPDQVHHWYDHFYCYRPCRTARTRDAQDG